VAIGKLLPDIAAYSEAFESAKDLSIVNGEVFDCVLAFTARGNVDTIWTENTRHFKRFAFLNTENPLVWKWEEE